MSIIKIEFPAGDKAAARAFGAALSELGGAVGRAATAPEITEHEYVPAPDHIEYEGFEDAHGVAAGDPGAYAETDEHVNEHTGEITATVSAGSTVSQTSDPAGADVKRDPKGVAFNKDMCSSAAEPFYASGKQKDQWKRKKGVAEGVYEEWYNAELLKGSFSQAQEEVLDEDGPTTRDYAAEQRAACAFGPKTGDAPKSEAPGDIGALMKWISDQQVAGNVSSEDVGAAYAANGLNFADVTGPNGAEACGVIYHHLGGQ